MVFNSTAFYQFNRASHSPCKQFSCLCNRNSLLHQAFSAHELCNALNQLIDSLLPSQPVMPVMPVMPGSVEVPPSKNVMSLSHAAPLCCCDRGLRNFRWESEAHVYILFRDHQLVSVGYLAATSSITRQQGVDKSNTNQDQDVLNPLKRECK